MSETMSLEELLNRDGHLAFTNKGVSMMPLLREDRDVMLIERKGSERCMQLDAVLFRRPEIRGKGAYVLHRILKVYDDGTYWIVGDNCISGETVAESQILGILTGVVRNGKTMSVKDWKYQLYVNTWCRWYHLRFVCLRARRLLGRLMRKTGIRKITAEADNSAQTLDEIHEKQDDQMVVGSSGKK